MIAIPPQTRPLIAGSFHVAEAAPIHNAPRDTPDTFDDSEIVISLVDSTVRLRHTDRAGMKTPCLLTDSITIKGLVMFCTSCGEKNSAGASYCAMCGTELSHAIPVAQSDPRDPLDFEDLDRLERRTSGASRRVENNLAKALLATFFCCLPLGVVAVVFAAQVDGRTRAGDYNGARRLAAQADTWANFSIGLGLVGGMIYFLAMMVASGI
ncbi:MAG: CD225/dispanin family protein [Planctomycetota bacterium]|nr:CD225/dispanin family protein [Planctomycetota bacterium]